MKKVTRRLAAGVSAAALLVSAVGFDAFTDLIMRPASADDASSYPKTGKSTGFDNLEQDTDKAGNYNTGYGLHTNKTASVAKDSTDGRTFDVGLESWYVGENPVDVATILDASGSMAWTVDTLEPLKLGFNYEEVEKYLKDKDDLNKYEDIENKETKLLTAIQDENGGYLPQEVVDLILDKTKTDDSKLSYAGYKYYVYEARPSVAEFVPLGYWDGGTPTGLVEPIGYYPFEGSLVNEITGGTASYIKHAEDTGDKFDITQKPVKSLTPIQRPDDKNSIDLAETIKSGALLLDVNANSNFTIGMRILSTVANGAQSGNYENVPLAYIGDDSGDNYILLYRRGKTDARKLCVGICKNGKYEDQRIDLDHVFDKIESKENIDWNNVILSYDGSELKLKVFQKNSKTVLKENSYLLSDFNTKDFKIVIGKELNDNLTLPYSNMDMTTFCVYENCLDGTDIATLNEYMIDFDNLKSKTSGLTAYYGFDDVSLKNEVSATDGSLTFIEQTTTGIGGALDSVPAKPEYSTEHYTANGKKSLNVTKTSEFGSVLLDVVPKNDGDFTISFAIRNSNASDRQQENGIAEIMYLGDLEKSEYYRIARTWKNKENVGPGDDRHLRFYNTDDEESAHVNNAFDGKNWHYVTFVVNDGNVYAYKDGVKDNENPSGSVTTLETDEINIIIAGLKEDYTGSDILLDDLYVYDTALTEEQVKKAYDAATGTTTLDPESCGEYHATTKIGSADVDIAQIKKGLANNPYDSQRAGWYYVNSHSEWKDIQGCLQSGKQYAGIAIEADDGEKYYSHEDVATDPDKSGAFNTADKDHADYVPPTTERSIRFYVDKQNHLRCFVCAGGTSKEGEPRTFCSVVYEKPDKGKTKYEELDDALDLFYSNLAKGSDLSNSAIVRFSTHNLLKNKSDTEAQEALKSLIVKKWTNWSDYYRNLTADEKGGKTIEDLKEDYMHDLLIPEEGETSLGVKNSALSSGEYPYVMTGGTYTWTGLKAFYDNMVKTKGAGEGGEDLTSGDTVYNIANDARDKYLIIFTDGRDNTVSDDGKDYVEKNKPEGSDIEKENELAKAWADKLKEEGYTIFCVMMAAGSISEKINPGEYNSALTFVTSLAGEVPDDENAENYVTVIGAGASSSDNNVEKAFNDILEKIQQPRDDYTVQDYIDPRFDLVDAGGNLYQLGANGNITVKNADGTTTDRTVENVIEKINETPTMTADECKALGLAYTPRESHMVNRKADPESEDGYDKGDGIGTGYLYYDDVKDMYYLRWTDQIIPMENESFDTGVAPNVDKYLEVWSATIRLKAKDDFIGGNNILTNGNEAGENLVYSDATIKNMDKGENYELYGLKEGYTYRDKLEALSGTNRKINAVDADGVSQAVYGDGIDIPSSGFPRTTVNVRLLKLNAKNLNDVIYMGEVVSPTMMLADLENDYMTGSYYLQYLERYAYRVYGNEAGDTPLIELLNKWLKIKDETVSDKTFTIPYIYLPDPKYDKNNNLVKDSGGKVVIENSTGWDSGKRDKLEFNDLNLCDITGFITYTWKRSDEQEEPQQKMEEKDLEGNDQYDITKDYVVKNTNQIEYNLQLKFTPLKKEDLPTGFVLDNNFIVAKDSGDKSDKFFTIDGNGEFADSTPKEWTITPGTNSNRTDYLQAMVQEKHTYEPHVMYNADAAGGGKWVLVDNSPGSSTHSTEKAVEAYKDADKSKQTTANTDGKTVTDKGVYDWDPGYKKAVSDEQIVAGKLKEYYTDTPDTVKFADASGTTIEGTSTAAPCSLTANTTYTKDVVNAALALEFFVDGKYLQPDSEIKKGDIFTFDAIRYYDDPIDPLPYGGTVNADTDAADGQKYQLKFKVNKLPDNPQPNEIYQVWATLEEVKVENPVSPGDYKPITADGYTDVNALPIGTYAISVDDMNDGGTSSQYYLGEKDGGGNEYFEYLKTDSTASNYKYDKFPDSVYKVSKDAATDTNDGEYLILNGSTDNSPKNIAENDRKKVADTQTATFYFGTVESRKVGTETLYNTKGESAKDYLKEHPNDKQLTGFKDDYAKDRLGIIMLSADNNSLAITKKVTNTSDNSHDNDFWNFTVTVTPTAGEDADEFKAKNVGGFKLTWYRDGEYQTNSDMGSYYDGGTYPDAITFTDSDNDGKYTATIYLKHNEKVVINGLQDGTWQVTENITGFVCTPHNNQSGWGDSWEYHNSPATDVNTLTPLSQVDFVNEFPYALPSAGGDGINLTVYTGIVLILAGGIWLILLRRKAHSRDKPSEGGCP